jgi:hypothetical protein
MKRLVKSAFVFLCIIVNLNAAAQVEGVHGTIVVVYFSQDEAIIAADSRGGEYGGQRDDDCKIATFSNKIIIASAGFRSLDLTIANKQRHWDSHVVAHQAFTAINSTQLPSNQEFVTAVTSKWAELAVNFFRPLAVSDPSGLIQTVKPYQNIISEVIFVGRDRDGKILAMRSLIYVDVSRGRKNPTVEKTIAAFPLNKLSVIGSNAIVLEFSSPASTMSTRAKKEIAAFELSIATETPERKLELRVIQFVRWTIAYGPADVGGETDAIKFNSTGIHWIQKKQTCKDE